MPKYWGRINWFALLMGSIGGVLMAAAVDTSAIAATVGPPVQIAGAQYGEGVIAVDPNNPNHLVAAGINVNPQAPAAAYFSFDGGSTWTTANIPGGSTGWSDPEIDFDLLGNVYLVVWT